MFQIFNSRQQEHEWGLWRGLRYCTRCGILQQSKRSPVICGTESRLGPGGAPVFAWNNDKGVIYCGFCDWSHSCGNNIELMEHVINQHLRDKHSTCAALRVDTETQEAILIP